MSYSDDEEIKLDDDLDIGKDAELDLVDDLDDPLSDELLSPDDDTEELDEFSSEFAGLDGSHSDY